MQFHSFPLSFVGNVAWPGIRCVLEKSILVSTTWRLYEIGIQGQDHGTVNIFCKDSYDL